MSVNIERRSFKNEAGGVIDISIDAADQILTVEKMLGDLKGKTPGTLKNAVNATARKMRTQMAQRAKKVYVSKEFDYKTEMEIKKASISKLTAKLHASGERTALSKHKVSPDRLAHGKGRPKHYKAKVLKKSKLEVMRDGDLKSFLVRFSSGHVALVQRDPEGKPNEREEQRGKYTPDGAEKRIKKYGRSADMTRIVEKKALSVAEMLGSPEVYGVVENGMGSLLQQEIENFVKKTIDGKAAKKKR